MIRLVLFFVALAALALGIGWILDRPGEISIVWLGWRIDTSVAIGLGALAAVVAAAILAWSLLLALWRTPRRIVEARRHRRARRGLNAVSRGLVAVGAGDATAAGRFAREARRFSPHEPLARLLEAQTAQMTGDAERAERAFRDMSERPETRLLGLHGLFVEAQRRKDSVSAERLAEEAARAAPGLPWATQAVLDFRCAANDWAGALAVLENQLRSGALERSIYARRRAVLLTARAMEIEQADPNQGRQLAQEAAKLAPDLIPAAVLAGRLAARAGDLRRAAKTIEAAWRRTPHPDLAQTYAHLRPGDSARDRLARVRSLTRESAGHLEGALAVARAAIDAREFKVARDALEPFLDRLTQRIAVLMAEIDEGQHGDIGRAREWIARGMRAEPDPTWVADGLSSPQWMPTSPVTGRLDAFEWKQPKPLIGGVTMLDAQAESMLSALLAAPTPGRSGDRSGTDATSTPAALLPAAGSADASVATTSAEWPSGAVPIAPVVPPPDDPGSDIPLAPSSEPSRRSAAPP